MKKIYGYDVYFRLKTPAFVLVAAHNKEEAKKKAFEYLEDIPREELIARIMAAVEFSPNNASDNLYNDSALVIRSSKLFHNA